MCLVSLLGQMLGSWRRWADDKWNPCIPFCFFSFFIWLGRNGTSKIRSRSLVRGCLDLVFSITHHPIFITHHSKTISPMHAPLVWINFNYLFPSLITQQIEWWVIENENKKTCFWVIRTELWWHNGNFPHIMGPTIIVLSRHSSSFTPHQRS